jgi:hypothetical protein
MNNLKFIQQRKTDVERKNDVFDIRIEMLDVLQSSAVDPFFTGNVFFADHLAERFFIYFAFNP